MALFTLLEIIHIAITVAVVSYIFSGLSKNYQTDPFQRYSRFFDWEDFKFTMIIASPGIILHELAHKFIGVGFGLQATYQVWPTGLVIGVLLKLFGSGFILLAPGYVLISGANALQSSLTAFAGPATNLMLWVGATYLLKHMKNISHKKAVGLSLLQGINKWLFIFNMIPLPPLDGFKVFAPLITAFF